jgi:hypothetical protein
MFSITCKNISDSLIKMSTSSWLGSNTLNQLTSTAIINGKTVWLIPVVDLANHTISSLARNTKTLMYTLPGRYDAGVYEINAEFQTNNTSGGNTAYAAGDSVDWTVQGIGDASPDFAEAVYRPFYACYTDGAGNNSTTGIVKATPSGITGITANNTQMGIYIKYNTNTAGTITMTHTVVTISIQKIA